jgi:hypothetical protein
MESMACPKRERARAQAMATPRAGGENDVRDKVWVSGMWEMG